MGLNDIQVVIEGRNNSGFREFFLKPSIYGVTAKYFYYLRKQPPKFVEHIDPELKRGLEWNFKKRLINNQLRPDQCFRIARAHHLDIGSARVLIIGPRSFSELLLGYFHGFSWKNIDGFDLYSEHPKVLLGNLESVDPKFYHQYDVVVCSGVLNYCRNIQSAMNGLIALSKDKALVIIQQDLTDDMFNDDEVEWSSFKTTARMSLEQKLDLVKDHVVRVTFREDYPIQSFKGEHQYVAFRVKK